MDEKNERLTNLSRLYYNVSASLRANLDRRIGLCRRRHRQEAPES